MVRSQTHGGQSVSAANGNRKSAAFSEEVEKKLSDKKLKTRARNLQKGGKSDPVLPAAKCVEREANGSGGTPANGSGGTPAKVLAAALSLLKMTAAFFLPLTKNIASSFNSAKSSAAKLWGLLGVKLREYRARGLGRLKRLAAGSAAIFRNAFKNTKNPLKISARIFKGTIAAAARHREFAKSALCTLAPLGGAAALAFTLIFWSSGIFALKVTLDGDHIAYIKSEAVYNEAQNKLASRLIGSEEDLNLKVEFTFTKVDESEISDANTLVNRLLECSSLDLTDACGLYIDDKFVAACCSADEISEILKSRLAEEAAKDQSVSVSYYSKIELLNGLYKQNSIIKEDELKNIISAETSPLSIQSTKTVTITQDVAFTTVEIEDKTKEKSYLKVTSEGKNGQETITESIIYINGIESRRIIENSEIIKKPVDKKIVKGTGEAVPEPVTAAVTVADGDGVATGGYTWPVEKVSRSYISSYWGDGRGHRGIDIAAPAGTSIYAADGGTVTKVGNHFKYGLYFIVDHGGGITTLYSHCSAVNVKEGQTVTRGQTIAQVGRTGNATGNHLHFEVMINNVKVNPMPYFK